MKEKEILKALVRIHNVTFPRSGFQPGGYAIVRFDVIKILEGEIPRECDSNAYLREEYKEKIQPFLNEGKEIPYFIKEPKQIITVKGNMPTVSDTNEFVLTANHVKDAKWGDQYEVITLRLNYNLKTEEDKRKFFSMFLTENQINNLFESVEDPLGLLESKNIGELKKIKGVGEFIARRMCEKYEACKDNSQAYVALADLNLTKAAIDKLIRVYHSSEILIEKINTNPYILASEVSGYGWKKCDEIAMKKGFTRDCQFRVLSYMKYFLEEQADSLGNSWVNINVFLTAVQKECTPVTDENLMNWTKENICKSTDFEEFYSKYIKRENGCKRLDEMPFLYYDAPSQSIGLFKIRFMEKQIARHLQRLKEAPQKTQFEKDVCDKIIEECEKEQGFEYTEEQKEGIWKIVNSNISILTGGAGTGKTSTLSAITKIFDHYNLRIQQCALSGKAASKLTQVTHKEGKTIHRLLNYIPDIESFKYTELNPLCEDIIILDETSMVGGDIYLSLIQSIRSGSKFIMAGDHKQLEAIGLANVFKDCLFSEYIPSVTLTKIHRQAAASGIITQSLHLSCGEKIVANDFIGEEVRGELKDFKIVSSFNSELVATNIIKEFKRLYLEEKIPADDIQVIVPMKTGGNISCLALNKEIQDIVNPPSFSQEITLQHTINGKKFETTYRERDKIIINKNNYHACNPEGVEKPIFNGNLGYIKNISNEKMIINVDGVGDIVFPRELWFNFSLAYAITCHKLQGSQSPYCIFGLNMSNFALFSKELLYTAVTRAQKYCVLVTQPLALNKATEISNINKKQTWLQKDLKVLSILEKHEKTEEEK